MSLQDISDLLKLLNEVELTSGREEAETGLSWSPIMLLNVRHQRVSMELTMRKHLLSLLALMKLISLLMVLCSISQTCMLSSNFHMLYFFSFRALLTLEITSNIKTFSMISGDTYWRFCTRKLGFSKRRWTCKSKRSVFFNISSEFVFWTFDALIANFKLDLEPEYVNSSD